jgi:23S rRNA pseudouridine1911/1915/1917 synthase
VKEPPFEILFADNHLLAVNKPAGILTQPTAQEGESLELLLKQWVKERYQKPGNVFLGTVHRLDRPVSGVVLFARTSKALTRINEAVRSGKFQKRYVALVEGLFPQDEGIFEDQLCHGSHRAWISEETLSKQARLHFKVLQRCAQKTLVRIELETGRYHQIRLQFASRGFPILGDQKYGSRIPLAGQRIALHHQTLRFPHPITQQLVEIETPVPFLKEV